MQQDVSECVCGEQETPLQAGETHSEAIEMEAGLVTTDKEDYHPQPSKAFLCPLRLPKRVDASPFNRFDEVALPGPCPEEKPFSSVHRQTSTCVLNLPLSAATRCTLWSTDDPSPHSLRLSYTRKHSPMIAHSIAFKWSRAALRRNEGLLGSFYLSCLETSPFGFPQLSQHPLKHS
ncbi:hypothetical protein F2P79_009253 [Pimephales promelas]|nr:hypothetical protein F2P79_009253 [Pimephales promelas]